MQLGIPSPPKRRLSLTPLIDVVFILLLFFMLASSFIEWREIDLNVAGSNTKDQKTLKPMLIRVTERGLILNGTSIEKEDLLHQLSKELVTNPELAVVLQPQPAVSLQKLVTLMDKLRETGARQVSFMRDSEKNI